MIRLKEVTYNLCAYGPAIAHPILTIEFEHSTEERTPEELWSDIQEMIQGRVSLRDAYNLATSWKQTVYFLFKGPIFDDKESVEAYRFVFDAISRESAQMQRALLDAHTINAGQMRPPFFMWEGVPTVFTGTDSKYNDFNVVYTVLNSKTEYSPIALQQFMNNPFGTVLIEWEDLEKTQSFLDSLLGQLPWIRCFLYCSDVKKFAEAKDYALKNNICLYSALPA